MSDAGKQGNAKATVAPPKNEAGEATIIDSKHAHAPSPTINGGAPGSGTEQTLPALDKTVVTDQRPSSHGNAGPGSRPPTRGSGSGSANSYAGTESINLSVPVQDLSGEGMLTPTRRVQFDAFNVPSLGGIPLLHKLGQGGMGAVYYGIHPGLRIEVAVKVLPLALAQPQMIQRFYREAQIAAKIQSPHLVAVRDVSEDSGLYYLVMEYVSGMSAGSYMRRLKKESKQITEADALEICIAATEGLAVAHRRGIIHRDIKPDNILIPKGDRASQPLSFQEAKLADLGLARNEDGAGGLTGTSSGLGTPGYMAPEQAADASKVKKAADVWSMGASLYGLLAGRPPFRGDTPINIIMASMQSPHDPIKGERSDVSAATARLIDICLSKTATERYVDGPALLEALKTCRAALHGGEAGQKKAIEQLGVIQKAAEQGLPLPTVDAAALSGSREQAVKAQTKKQSSSPVGLIAAGVVIAGLVGVGAFVMTRPKVEDPAVVAARQQALKAKQELEAQQRKIEELQKQAEEERKSFQTALDNIKKNARTPEQEKAGSQLFTVTTLMLEKSQKKDVLSLDEIHNAQQTIDLANLAFGDESTTRKTAELLAKSKKSYADATAKQADELLKKDAPLEQIDTLVKNIEETDAANSALPKLKKDLETKRAKIQAEEAEKKKQAEFKNLLTKAESVFAGGDVDGAELALKKPLELYANDAGALALKKKIDETRARKAEEARRSAFDKKVIETSGKLDVLGSAAEIDASLADLEKMYPGDAALKPLKDKATARKAALAEQAQRAQWSAAIGKLETQVSSATEATLPQLEREAAALNPAYANDPRTSALRSGITTRRAQLAEDSRKASIRRSIDGANSAIARKESVASLQRVEGELKQLEDTIPKNDPLRDEVSSTRDRVRRARSDLEAALKPPDAPPSTPREIVKKKRVGEEEPD